MTIENKGNLLERLEKRVEKHLSASIQTFQNLDEHVLLQPSSSGGWSIAQCLEHLNTYGVYYLPQIKNAMKKMSGDSSDTFFKSTWLGKYFTRMMEPESGKKKFKAFKNHVPAFNLDPHAVVAEFINQQEELLSLLKLARTKDLNKIKIPISITRLIKLRLGDVFQFLIAHNERHLEHAKRNLS